MARAILNQILNQLDTLEPEELQQLNQAVAKRFTELKAKNASREKYDALLAKVPNVDPEPYDRLPTE